MGASSGGFIGTILAMELGAERSYSFAGQFSLRHHFDHLQVNPFLREYLAQNGDYWFEYYKRISNSEVQIIYMYPNKSEQDQEQYALVKDIKSVYTVEISIDEHGVAIYPFAIPQYLSYDVMDAKKLAGEGTASKLKMSIKIGGLCRFAKWAVRKAMKKVKGRYN